MRPDVEDYEDIEEAEPRNVSRAMSWVVLAVAVGGFAALAYYAYHSGNAAQNEGETLLVEANDAPIKQAPQNPDGEEFANKDKTIYDVIAPSGTADKVEKLMPEPERPVAAANVEDVDEEASPMPEQAPDAVAATPAPATTSFAAPEAVKKQAPVVVAATSTPIAQTPVAKPAVEAPTQVHEVPVATVAKPVEPVATKPAVVEKSFSSPEMINEKPSTKKPEAKAEPEKKVEKPVVAASAGGAYKLQLGAFKSEAEAQAAWKKMSAKHSAVLSGASNIVKAEVNGGTFYRLRAGSYATSADAKAACAKLGSQACIPVK